MLKKNKPLLFWKMLFLYSSFIFFFSPKFHVYVTSSYIANKIVVYFNLACTSAVSLFALSLCTVLFLFPSVITELFFGFCIHDSQIFWLVLTFQTLFYVMPNDFIRISTFHYCSLNVIFPSFFFLKPFIPFLTTL